MRQMHKTEPTELKVYGIGNYEDLTRGMIFLLSFAFVLLATMGCGFAAVKDQASGSSVQIRQPKIYLTRLSTKTVAGQELCTTWNVEVHIPARNRMSDMLPEYGRQGILEITRPPGVQIVRASTYAQKEPSKISVQLGNLAWGNVVRAQFTLSLKGSEIPALKSRLLFRKGQKRYAVHVAEQNSRHWRSFEKSAFFSMWKNRHLRDVFGQRLDSWLTDRQNENGYGFVY